MNCAKCNASLPNDASYCPACGAATVPANPVSGGDVAPAGADPLRAQTAVQRGVDVAEQEIWQGTYSPKAMLWPALGVAVASIAAIVIAAVWKFEAQGWWIILAAIAVLWLALGAMLLYHRLSIFYRLTNQRFFHHRGILHRVVDRIEVIDMDDISYSQNIVERMLGIGTIRVTSSDSTHPELRIVGIDDVQQVASRLDAARRAERMRRGLHIEAV